jgi:hypothetical protein
VGTKPLLNPPVDKGWQGSPKELCTTEWFFMPLAKHSQELKPKELTAGLKLNSMTSPINAVMLLEEYCSSSFGLTITLVFRSPPTGSPFTGEVLVEALLAAALNASIVLPVVGLALESV